MEWVWVSPVGVNDEDHAERVVDRRGFEEAARRAGVPAQRGVVSMTEMDKVLDVVDQDDDLAELAAVLGTMPSSDRGYKVRLSRDFRGDRLGRYWPEPGWMGKKVADDQ